MLAMAYLPQNVSRTWPGVYILLNPKSAIFMFMSLSSSKFSACPLREKEGLVAHSYVKRHTCDLKSVP